MDIPKETDDDDIVKYKRQGRKLCLNYQVWHENNPNPTQEEAKALIKIAQKLIETATDYVDNIPYWIKRTTTHKLKEHQEYLDTGTDAQEEE